jgi:hypothetical protein
LRGFKIGSDPRVFEIGNRPLARIATKGDPGAAFYVNEACDYCCNAFPSVSVAWPLSKSLSKRPRGGVLYEILETENPPFPAGFFGGRSWIRTTDLRLIRAAL